MVMRCGAKVSVLGDHAVLPYRDFGDAIERRIVANPTMITDLHLPREGDANPRSDQNPVTHFSPEEPPHEPPPGVKHLWCRPHEQGVEKPPKLDEPRGSLAGPLRQSKTREILKLVESHCGA